jgi:uncharacterized protein (DUF983 family)
MTDYPPLSPLLVALQSRCPRCGRGRLYQGWLKVVPKCENCGLTLQHQDSGDGPAVFGILIVGALAVVVLLYMELTFQPPIWVHIAVQTPLILGGSLICLRFFKSIMIALQYKNRIGGFEEED